MAPTVSGTVEAMSGYLVSESKVIAAEPQTLFDIVADPSRHPELDGSGSVKATTGNVPDRLSMGATFAMDMKLGASYKIMNTVVEFDEPARIAWRHFNGHVWRYLFEAVDGATLVTEQWDARPVLWKYPVLLLMGFPARNRKGIKATLERLAELAAAPQA
jgi:hypothetical protein